MRPVRSRSLRPRTRALLLALAALAFSVTSRAEDPAWKSDFAPPKGRAANPPRESAGERRLLIAWSDDGFTFSPSGKILTDQANVPDAIVTADGTVWVYYIGQGIGTKPEVTVAACSRDGGTSWIHRFLNFHGLPSPRDPSDPDVVLLPDGTLRMFYTDSLGRDRLGIRYADSKNGVDFTYGGVALDAGFTVIDSTTFRFAGKWHMYVLDERKPVQYHATSDDGASFRTDGKPMTLRAPAGHYIGSNPLVGESDVRLFGFSFEARNIGSFRSTDGATWTAEPGARLVADRASLLDGSYLQDSTVVRLENGRHLLVYVSDIPRAGR